MKKEPLSLTRLRFALSRYPDATPAGKAMLDRACFSLYLDCQIDHLDEVAKDLISASDAVALSR